MKHFCILLLGFVLFSCSKKEVELQVETINFSRYEGNFTAYKVGFLAMGQSYPMPYNGLSCRLAVTRNKDFLNFNIRRIVDGKEVDQINIDAKGMYKEDLAYVLTDGKNRVKITDAEFTVFIQESTTYYYFKR